MFYQLSRSKILPSLVAIAACGVTVGAQRPASAATLVPVNVELSLLVDVSPSINGEDYRLQMTGYQDAFRRLAAEFGAGTFGTVAVNLIQWAGPTNQQQSIPWTLLNSPESALQFADAILALRRPTGFFGTEPGAAIEFATPLFSSNSYDGQRWVIDVSGDGVGNTAHTRLARDNALAAGVSAINGLPIVPLPTRPNQPPSGLERWYQDNLQGGEGSFILAARGFEDVGVAMEQKLRRELTTLPPQPPSETVPEPSVLLGLGLLAGGLGLQRRSRA